jgi:ribosomal protein S18 acetylase RimI-like enzyme
LPPIRSTPPGLVIRPAAAPDEASIEQLVLNVVREVYGRLIPGDALPTAGRWSSGLVAEVAGRIVGVVVSDDDWVEDLWVATEYRNRGIGGMLLTTAERQIASRKYTEAQLRVVAENLDARRFYATHGWAETVSYPHEKWGFEMVEMVKAVAA